MQDVAREMNLSETAFLLSGERRRLLDLRWFTPAIEVELCGHATLASAHVLWETGGCRRGETARFHTRSGLLTAERQGRVDRAGLPRRAGRRGRAAARGSLEALGVRAASSWARSGFDYLVEVASEEAVRAARARLAPLRRCRCAGVIVTAAAATRRRYDFVSRFFAPGAGVDEDPVTGSAHCALGPYWARRLGKDELLAYQASARGGEVRVRVEGDRVKLGGQAVTVLRGELLDSARSE